MLFLLNLNLFGNILYKLFRTNISIYQTNVQVGKMWVKESTNQGWVQKKKFLNSIQFFLTSISNKFP